MKEQYVMCIDNEEYPDDLVLHKVYQVVEGEADEALAAKAGMVRVVDETGEDYLYSARLFVPVELSEVAEAAFSQAIPAA
jgi:hypothetical protein